MNNEHMPNVESDWLDDLGSGQGLAQRLRLTVHCASPKPGPGLFISTPKGWLRPNHMHRLSMEYSVCCNSIFYTYRLTRSLSDHCLQRRSIPRTHDDKKRQDKAAYTYSALAMAQTALMID